MKAAEGGRCCWFFLDLQCSLYVSLALVVAPSIVCWCNRSFVRSFVRSFFLSRSLASSSFATKQAPAHSDLTTTSVNPPQKKKKK